MKTVELLVGDDKLLNLLESTLTIFVMGDNGHGLVKTCVCNEGVNIARERIDKHERY